jgi:hypothetical protein
MRGSLWPWKWLVCYNIIINNINININIIDNNSRYHMLHAYKPSHIDQQLQEQLQTEVAHAALHQHQGGV